MLSVGFIFHITTIMMRFDQHSEFWQTWWVFHWITNIVRFDKHDGIWLETSYKRISFDYGSGIICVICNVLMKIELSAINKHIKILNVKCWSCHFRTTTNLKSGTLGLETKIFMYFKVALYYTQISIFNHKMYKWDNSL